MQVPCPGEPTKPTVSERSKLCFIRFFAACGKTSTTHYVSPASWQLLVAARFYLGSGSTFQNRVTSGFANHSENAQRLRSVPDRSAPRC